VTGQGIRMHTEERAATTYDRLRGDWVRISLAVVALLLVASSLILPLWRSALSAPQYPEGLSLIVYGNRAEGDLAEIDSLNHYIGMRSLRLEEFPELALWPLGVAAAGVAVVLAFFGNRLLTRLARILLWAFPLSILAVIQFRLNQFGHDLDPGAAFRMDGFTPWVIGPTRVWNFTAWSWPGNGVLALLLAAALATFGLRLTKRLRRATRSVTVAALVAAAMVVALPAGAAHDGHDDGGGHPVEQPQSPVGVWGSGDGPSHAQPSSVTFDRGSLIDLEALIAGVADGGTLILPAGAYAGGVTIDKALTIEGRGMPVVVGSGQGTVITITAPRTTIRGIQVTGSGPGPSGQPAGIRVAADEVVLEGVVVADSYIGIAVDNVATVRILDSLILGRSQTPITGEGHVDGSHDGQHVGGRGDGISLWEAESVLIRGTRIQDVRDGVYVSFGSSVLIDTNVVVGSRYGVHTMYAADLVLIENLLEDNLSAAVLMYGGPVDVIRNGFLNNVSPSTGFGLLLKDVTDAQVIQNTVVGNRVGLHLDGPAGGSSPIALTANTVAENHFGVMIYPSAAAVFMANSFVDNLVQVAQQGRGSAADIWWADRGWGNFWSTYQGYDNGEGKGVVPHIEGSSVNRILARSPLLTPIASSPAMRLIGAIEDRWLQQSPAAVDELPLTVPVSPPLPPSVPDPTAVMTAGIAGFALVVAAGTSFAMLARRPRIRTEGVT
jgi:nitrous oxidase accessory protein